MTTKEVIYGLAAGLVCWITLVVVIVGFVATFCVAVKIVSLGLDWLGWL